MLENKFLFIVIVKYYLPHNPKFLSKKPSNNKNHSKAFLQ